jgi:hypothetical protein
MTQTTDSEQIREAVREHYAAAARAVTDAKPQTNCCSSESSAQSCCAGPSSADIITSDLYSIDEVGQLPTAAVLASLGCGNPTALAELKPGEVVLDLGSGGGIDVLLSARRVGATASHMAWT